MTEKELLEKAESMDLDEWQILQVKLGLKILPVSSILIYLQKELSHRQMEQMRISLMDGIEPKTVKKVMKAEIGYEGMQQIRLRELQNVHIGQILQSIQKMESSLSHYAENDSNREETIAQLKEKIQELEITIDSQQQRIVQYEETLKRVQSQNVVHGEQFKEKNLLKKFFCRNNKCDDLLSKVEKQKFDAKQIEEIRLSVEDGLTEEQIMMIAVPNIEAEKMQQLRLFYKTVNQKNSLTITEDKKETAKEQDVLLSDEVFPEEDWGNFDESYN